VGAVANRSAPAGISLPQGGGAIAGLGETFHSDLHSGTGTLTIPLELPQGRNGFTPELALTYGSGTGNGPFGLGWSLTVPFIARKTSAGVPRYRDTDADPTAHDIFQFTGQDDLVAVQSAGPATGQRFRPRTEGAFGRIERHPDPADPTKDTWEVHGIDGRRSVFGGLDAGGEPAAITNPATGSPRIFSWALTRIEDPFRNRIEYLYERDAVRQQGPPRIHHWDQLYLSQIRYADHGDPDAPDFLVSIRFGYENRPDPFSTHRAGFEIRTVRRCTSITVATHLGGVSRPERSYRLRYVDPAPLNGISLLGAIELDGEGSGGHQPVPPLLLGYREFDPARRVMRQVPAAQLPPQPLGDPSRELIDLSGDGLPDLVELGASPRYWRNRGDGGFDAPRPIPGAPASVRLEQPGVQLADADGDGRADVLVTATGVGTGTGTAPGVAGYCPIGPNGPRGPLAFRPFRQAPPFSLEDAAVRLVDLTGDGVTDAVRSGSSIECYFAAAQQGWEPTAVRYVPRQQAEAFPDLDFADPRVTWADMNGDGLTDPVLVHDGSIQYWPSRGHGDWGPRVTMERSPHLPFGHDPQRILLVDVDGDGLADFLYVGYDSLTLWINRAGNGWSDPVTVPGTPTVADPDNVRAADLLGTGVAGVLWGADLSSPWQRPMYFLDFTGGGKPYLLTEVDNNRGATTHVEYAPSTTFLVQDEANAATRWRTSLPFPVQVVRRIRVDDRLSGASRSIERRYRHGLWDDRDREFRGFARVEELDVETTVTGPSPPPVLTRTWFHLGAVPTPSGDAVSLDLSDEYWAEDPQLLTPPASQVSWLAAMSQAERRDALRALRGRQVREERYLLDGTAAARRPQSVSETLSGLVPLPVGAPPSAPPAGWQRRVHFPHVLANRFTTWERGEDPHTVVTFTDRYDRYGQPGERTVVALPRASIRRSPITADVVGAVQVDKATIQAVHTVTERAVADPGLELHDRVAHERSFALRVPPGVTETRKDDLGTVLRDQVAAGVEVHRRFGTVLRAWTPGTPLPAEVRLLTHDVRRYDDLAFTGRPPGEIGPYGALTSLESLVLDAADLAAAYGAWTPTYLGGTAAPPPGAPAGFGTDLGYRQLAASAEGYHDGWYVYREQRQYDVQDAAATQQRGLVTALRDALGHRTDLQPDPTWMFPGTITDPVGLVTTVEYDRLKVSGITDANGHAVRVRYTPLGLVARVIHQRRGGGGGTDAAPEIEFRYDLGAYARTRNGPRPQPIWVHHRRRVRHVDDPDDDGTVVEAREFSDGFGRLLQLRTEAEELAFGPAGARGEDVGLPVTAGAAPSAAQARRTAGRVVVSGWQVYDVKGRVVERYEPFFATGWDYQPEAEAKLGLYTRLSYDPLGRLTLTVRPDGSRNLEVHGVPTDLTDPGTMRPTAWETTRYDANDLAPSSMAPGGGSLAATAPAAHHFTPRSDRLDALGRTIATLDRPGQDPARWTLTRPRHDELGRLVEVVDPVGRATMRLRHDRLDRVLRTESIDSGTSLTVYDAAGNAVDVQDADGRRTLRRHDGAGRLVEVWARDRDVDDVTLRERVVHGDALPDLVAARAANLLGRIAVHHDEAGVQELHAYDSRGNVTERTRRVIGDAALAAGWTPNWAAPDAAAILDQTRYEVSTRYDALDRLTELHCPDDHQDQGHRPVFRMSYGKGSTLTGVTIDGQPYLRALAHDAHGQRLLAHLGNGLLTRYAYHPTSRRLARVRSEPCATGQTPDGALTWTATGQAVQDYTLSYDLAGNLTEVDERVAGCGVAGTPDGRNRLRRSFGHDAVYRLVSATGRACANIAGPRPIQDLRRCGAYQAPPPAAPNQANAPDLTELYTEQYGWDPVGNLVSLTYQAAATWTRRWALGGLPDPGWQGAPDNRATLLRAGSSDHSYGYDLSGNLKTSDADGSFVFDHAGRLTGFTRRAGAGPASVEARYLYGTDGTRVKKWVRRNGATTEATVHIDGFYEHHPDNPNGPSVQLHVLDGARRIAAVRLGPAHPDDAGPAEQYHLEDYARSSHIVVDGAGGWINREEYFPFGETSFGSFARKRYRFQGHHRDDETGLDLHNARYYAPWLGRWVSCDPAGLVDGTSRYAFARGSPLQLVDPTGLQGEPAQSEPPPGPLTHVLIVGVDKDHHENPRNFPRALDTLLNTNTVEHFRESVQAGDHILVLVPPSMTQQLQDRIEASLRRFRDAPDIRPTAPPPGERQDESWFTVSLDVTFEVRAVPAPDVARVVNEQRPHSVRNLAYFGHGARSAPIFDIGFPIGNPARYLPPAASFSPEPFTPDARALFPTCNSWQYAEKFTGGTRVTSTGVQGTTYYGTTEISAGRIKPDAGSGTSLSFTYTSTDAGVVSSGPNSLSQRADGGVPFLRLAPPEPPRVPAPALR
jgi:RHS repeat-associated protein